MAITYLTGIPRSGKSYYAVYKLYRYFVGKFPSRPNWVLKFAFHTAKTTSDEFSKIGMLLQA
jgi:hypothetical protein